jgi:adenylosuccinate lyase
MASENVLMAAVAAGADRQEAHEHIRKHSRAVTRELREGGVQNDLLDRLRADPLFTGVDLASVLVPEQFVGRAPQQVDEFMAECVDPVRQRYPHLLNQGADIER